MDAVYDQILTEGMASEYKQTIWLKMTILSMDAGICGYPVYWTRIQGTFSTCGFFRPVDTHELTGLAYPSDRWTHHDNDANHVISSKQNPKTQPISYLTNNHNPLPDLALMLDYSSAPRRPPPSVCIAAHCTHPHTNSVGGRCSGPLRLPICSGSTPPLPLFVFHICINCCVVIRLSIYRVVQHVRPLFVVSIL